MKITFLGAGSTVFARNVLGDCMHVPSLRSAEMALYDISAKRLEESRGILEAINQTINEGRAKIRVYHGMERLEDALRDAAFVVNAIQVGGYDPATLTDFEIPRKYGLRQTIGDTIGIGGIMRGLRTIPVMERFASVMERACPGALLLNYTNPMSILTGYMLRYTDVACVGLCHSVQVCSEMLLKDLGMEDALEGRVETIAGINHMAWLLSLRDKEGNDLYPEIRKRALAKNAEEKHGDMVRYEYIRRLGYYCTESSEHNAEYNPFFIKRSYPELIDRFNIPLDEYLRRCVDQIEEWGEEFKRISSQGGVDHSRSHEYASYIMNAVATSTPFKIHGNVLNDHLIDNLDVNACVEVPCLVDGNGINPCRVGSLPVHLAAMNMTNVNVHLTTIEAARTKRVEDIYHAAMLDPHTAAELSIDDIVSMCDEMIEAHGPLMEVYT